MPNTEIFELYASFVTPVHVYLNWILSPLSPTDTIETDTFYLSYTNHSTMETTLVPTARRMNYRLALSPDTTYTMFVYSINFFSEQSANSDTVTLHTGPDNTNPIRTNGFLRVFETTELTETTIEDLNQVVSVSPASEGIAVAEPTFVPIFTPTSPKPFYQLYKIDPKGQLFGNTPCTEALFKTRVIVV